MAWFLVRAVSTPAARLSRTFCVRNPLMRFTTKHLLASVSAVAVVLASLLFLNRSFAPDPASESFTVLTSEFTPTWMAMQPKSFNSTLVSKMESFVPESGYGGASGLDIDQLLFRYAYTDYFGTPTYGISYRISGHAAHDWSDFYISPTVTGGGNVGASCEITSHFDAGALTLTVDIHQQFRAEQVAKMTTLTFVWDGTRFVRPKDTEPLRN